MSRDTRSGGASLAGPAGRRRRGGARRVPGGPRRQRLIDEIRPDTTLTFGPDGQTYHVDHIAISRWTTQAVAAARHPTRLLYAAMTEEWVQLFADHGVDLSQVIDGSWCRAPDRPA